MLEIKENAISMSTSESLKEIRTNLLYGEEKIIGFTSLLPSEGKTTVTLQLAHEFSLLGKKVCVLECDLKKPSMHKVLQIKQPEGLADYLQSTGKEIINRTNLGFDIVFAGKNRSNTTEILSSKRFDSFLQTLALKYDYVLIDTTPVTGSIDAKVVGNQTDGMVFVVRQNHTSAEKLARAILDFKKSGIKIIGAVLNRVRDHEKDYYYYYGD